jgi:hypothetical protein
MEPLAPTAFAKLARPPREVPFRTALALRLGETMVQVGSAALALFGAVTIFLLANADIASLWRYRGELERVEARVTAVEDTGMGEGRGAKRGRSRPILRFTFEFEQAGRRHTETSYSSTQRVDPGAPVSVEFPRERPEFARIVGMRSDRFGPEALLFLIAPAIASFLLGWGLVRSSHALHLVRTGSVAQGVVQGIDRRPGRKQRRARQVSVEFESEPGRSACVEFSTSHPARFDVGQSVYVLFDAREPARGRVVEDFSFELPLDGRGRIAEVGFARLARYVVVPGLCIVALLVALVVA